MRWLRRLVILGTIATMAYLAMSRRRLARLETIEPVWPAFDVAPPAPQLPDLSPPARSAERWMLPLDGECPEGYPVKANDSSMIFHVPSGRFYSRVKPERCYARVDDALADGYRAARA